MNNLNTPKETKVNNRGAKLAILGGKAIRTSVWPKWPQAKKSTEKILLDVLHGGRWAISGPNVGKVAYERQFAADFAKYNKAKYAVPTTNGSSSLVIALLALGVGAGDEVLVPGSTWVACASSVLSVNAVPVMIDIDTDTLCMSVAAARKAITKNTKAIMIVHAFCALADLDGFVKLSKETGIPLIEDCSQAHGASWNGKK
ncbi:MAG: aminotransferase class I/II-fold pyridoxal phosphate-dependent enzyme [Patescibacteria group bacterium]